ncbi:hypothetical protein DMN91_002956 [Ooceraea biroi]|uniref:Uncharacterized protein n=1 Tax=Ooceraea biroi TaxID=2015173 RepID=A0A3L8DXQ1_OOCBI|nr:uncharacterized protein LOC105285959 [Ooceraea biroi]RLU24865.1 hypothetical protein DMN91_002956 [Ooceraea biroi]
MAQLKRLQTDIKRNIWNDNIINKEEDSGFPSDSLSDEYDEFDSITDQHKNFITMCKQKIDSSELPEHFNQWTAQKQYDHLIHNTSKYFPNIPESLRFILPASFKDGDCDRPADNKPDWLDMEKFRRGQKFALRYFSTICISNLISLLQIFSFSDGLKPLILSQKSNTPYRAFKRYLSTIRRVRNWYTSDPWCENTKAHHDIQMVRKLHHGMRRRLCEMDNEEIDRATKMSQPFCPAVETLMKDFAGTCPMARSLQNPYTMNRMKGINQGDMSGTQFAFISMMVVYPEQLGAHNPNEEDLEAFCHLWRGIGYLLGIEDQYNFCNDSLQEVRQRCRDMIEYWVKTNLRMVTPEWEHMSMCLFEGTSYIMSIKLNYKIFFMWMCDVLELDMRRFYDSFCLVEKVMYNLLKFALRYLTRLPGFLPLLNVLTHMRLDQAAHFEHKVHIKLMQKSSKIVPESIVHTSV